MAPPAAADRSALLNQIHKGAKLKKAVTNDRSAPIIGTDNKTSHTNGAASGGNLRANSVPTVGNNGAGSNAMVGTSPGGMGLGGLFAGGMPKLRSTGSRLVSSNENVQDSSTEKEPTTSKVNQERPSPSTIRPKPTLTNPVVASPPVNRRPAPAPPSSSTPTQQITAIKPPSAALDKSPVKAKNNVIRTTTTTTTTPLKSTVSPERRSTVPVVKPNPTILNGETTSMGKPPPLPATRPPLPSRPAGVIVDKVCGLSLNDEHGRTSKFDKVERASFRPPTNSRKESSSTNSASLSSVSVRWNFPSDTSLPRPTTHSGRGLVYPSGREKGCYIDESLSNTNPSPAPRIIPSKVSSTGGAVINAIRDKQNHLEAELEGAIARQDFEQCLALKPRIAKLKDMAELAEQGLVIDQAKIDSI